MCCFFMGVDACVAIAWSYLVYCHLSLFQSLCCLRLLILIPSQNIQILFYIVTIMGFFFH